MPGSKPGALPLGDGPIKSFSASEPTFPTAQPIDRAGWIVKYILYFTPTDNLRLSFRAALRASKIAPGDFVEPTNAGIKTRCLTTWRRPNNSLFLQLRQLAMRGILVQPLRHHCLPALRDPVFYRFCRRMAIEGGKNATTGAAHARIAVIAQPVQR